MGRDDKISAIAHDGNFAVISMKTARHIPGRAVIRYHLKIVLTGTKPARAKQVRLYTLSKYILGYGLGQGKCCCQSGRRIGRLDSISTLPRQPEKTLYDRIPANHKVAIRRKAA